jgi:ornithine carbamoyltransferase
MLSHPAFNVSPYLNPKSLCGADTLNRLQVSAVLNTANGLRQAARSGAVFRLLGGKNIALLCDQPTSPDAMLFEHAATQIGARVARIHPREAGFTAGASLIDTAKLFGRLYDAIECQGMDEDVVAQLAEQTGVVVYNGLGSITHPSVAWASLLPWDEDDTRGDQLLANREAIIQSVLLATVR